MLGLNFISCTKYFISFASSSFYPLTATDLTTALFLEKKIKEKQVLRTRHTDVWFADRSEACVWSDMHAGPAAGRGRAGHFLGSQAVRSSRTAGSVTARRDWYHPLKAAGTVSVSLLAWQTGQVSLAGVSARSRFGCIWSFCLPG